MKKFYYFIPLVVIIGIVIFYANKNQITKFYLEDEYYHGGDLIDVSREDVQSLIDDNKSFILFTYNNYCNFEIPCDDIFRVVAKRNDIQILSLPFEAFRELSLYGQVKYAPTVILIRDGEIVAYLDANSDDDYNTYQHEEVFSEWLGKYILYK